MGNAELFYRDIASYTDIRGLIGKQEDLYLDFKESRSRTGALLDDDKLHFSKAASGFAHQEGGVMVWGIEARKNDKEVDSAITLKPIPNIRAFLSALQDYVKYATDPVVDGIEHKIIFDGDDEVSGRGFAVSFFPKSDREHRSLGGTPADFYKRHGDSFSPLSTNDIRNLFYRSASPLLDIEIEASPIGRADMGIQFNIRNTGRGMAKYASALLGFSVAGGSWYDGEGNWNFRAGPLITISEEGFSKQFVSAPGIVIYPGQSFGIARANMTLPDGTLEIKYKCFAEGMIVQEGTRRVHR